LIDCTARPHFPLHSDHYKYINSDQKFTIPTIMIMFVVLALVATALAEPEADPQTLLYHQPTAFSPLLKALNTYKTVPANTYKSAPDIAYKTAPVVTYKTAPVVPYNAVPVPAVNTHTLTSYNNPNHYTAVSYGAFGPSYVTKNGPTVHVVKREAEADAQLPLASFAAPYTHAVTYKAAPVITYKTSPLVTYKTHPAYQPLNKDHKGARQHHLVLVVISPVIAKIVPKIF